MFRQTPDNMQTALTYVDVHFNGDIDAAVENISTIRDYTVKAALRVYRECRDVVATNPNNELEKVTM
jgi:hypothetical protein